MRILSALLATSMLAGCATENYGLYAQSMARIAEANASVAREQAIAIARIAEYGGDPTSRALAVMMLGIGANTKQPVNVAPPQNEALQWASVILPSITSIGLGYWGYRLGVHQSDNQASTTQASYGAIVGVSNGAFGTVSSFKPVPIDWSTFPTTSRIDVNNRDGQVVIGGDGIQDNSNRPIAIVPPVVVVPGATP